MGFITITKYLKSDVDARVAPTEMTDVVAAVVMIVVVGIGTSMSVNGMATICASGGMLSGSFTSGLAGVAFLCVVLVFVCLSFGASSFVSIPLTPGGGLRVLGGTTSGLYEGISALGSSSIGVGSNGASGRFQTGKTGGSAHSISLLV
tara:strand:- start:23 stop:466 length:444 start_codon:yes stop_codon:yes gene_type:complete